MLGWDNENQETIVLSGTSLNNIDSGQPSFVDNACIITCTAGSYFCSAELLSGLISDELSSLIRSKPAAMMIWFSMVAVDWKPVTGSFRGHLTPAGSNHALQQEHAFEQ